MDLWCAILALDLNLERLWLSDSLGESEGHRDELGQISEVPDYDLKPTEVQKPHHQLSYRELHCESDLWLVLTARGEPVSFDLFQSVVYPK